MCVWDLTVSESHESMIASPRWLDIMGFVRLGGGDGHGTVFAYAAVS